MLPSLLRALSVVLPRNAPRFSRLFGRSSSASDMAVTAKWAGSLGAKLAAAAAGEPERETKIKREDCAHRTEDDNDAADKQE